MRIFITLLMCLCMLNANADAYVRPPSGQDINETRHIKQLKAPQPDCVSAELEDAYIFMSKDTLAALAAIVPNTPNAPDNSEINRAKKTLALTTASKDKWGCEVVIVKDFSEFGYLALRLIEAGATAIYEKKTDAFVEDASINYYGFVCGSLCGQGYISVELPSLSRLLFLSWWVS